MGIYTRAVLFAATLIGAPATWAALPPAANLAVDGVSLGESGGTVVVLFTIDDCRYCETVKRRYLEPLTRDPRWQGRVLVREINASHTTPLKDFDGAATNHARFAARQGVQFYPTVRFYGADGSRRAPDIVGQVIDDFYWAYLREAVAPGQ